MKKVYFSTIILSIVLLSASIAAAQDPRLKTIVDGYRFDNRPIEVVSRAVGDRKFDSSNQLIAERDWIKHIQLEIKNVSSKNITRFTVEIMIPKQGSMVRPVAFSVEYPNAVLGESQSLIGPGESVTVKVNEMHLNWIKDHLAAHGVTEVFQVRLDLRAVIFDDETGWQMGLDLILDPQSKKYIPKNRLASRPLP